jgi:hypothetical protein
MSPGRPNGGANAAPRAPRYALSAALLSASALLSAAVFCPTARAQDSNPAAQALYDQATTEMDARKYEPACKKLEEVIRLVPDGLGAKMTLAQCYEGLGRLASAWSQYAQVESLARKTKQPTRMKKAAVKAAALKPKLAQLTINVDAAVRSVPGVEIARDGEAVGEAQWGLGLPVDKGAHTITARATGYRSWSQRIEVPADGKRVSVVVPPLESEPKPEPSASASASAAPSATAPPETPPPARPRTWQKPLGIVTLGLGVAGLAAGGTFGGLALVRFDESKKAGCNAKNQCAPAGTVLRNDARLFGDVSTIALIAGGALAASGIVLLITAPGGDKDKKEASFNRRPGYAVELAPFFGGAAVRGEF